MENDLNSHDIQLWLNSLKHAALHHALEKEGLSVEDKAQQLLDAFYEQAVPLDVRNEINTRISAATERQSVENEAARRFAVLRINEDVHVLHFECERYRLPISVANDCRNYLRHNNPDSGIFAARISQLVPIGQMEFFDHWDATEAATDERIRMVVDVDFNSDHFGYMMPGEKMVTYSMKDVTTAAYYAFKKDHLRDEQRQDIFETRLAGKEITYDTPVPGQEVDQDMTMV